MTISTNVNQVQYTGDGVSLAFSYPYPFITTNDIKVFVSGVQVVTGFTVTGVSLAGGTGTFSSGTVTFLVAPGVVPVLIYCDPDLLQSTSLPPNDPFPSKTVEKMVDKITLLVQRIYQKFGNAITFPPGDTASGVLPSASARAGFLLGFDVVTGALTMVTQTAGTAVALALSLASSTGSSLVGFIQAGVGAIARTVQSKLRDTCNAFDFMSAAGQAAVAAGTYHADVTTGLQAAIDSGFAIINLNQGIYRLDKPLLIKSGGTQNLKLVGHRVGSYLAPNAVSIATAPVSINALIINQNNDGKFSLERMRFWSDIGYTGIGVYAKEGGGSDGSAQCIFSGSMTDLWVDFGTANTGFFRGGLQNYHVSRITAENMKGVFYLDGAGNYDIDFRDISLYNCFDAVIDQTTDTLGSNQVSVSGVHAYTHNRGPLIKLQNCNGWTIGDMIVTSLPGNLGTVGLLDLLNCGANGSNKGRMLIDSLSLFSSAGVGQTADAIILNGVAAKISAVTIDGAANGITLAGANAFDLTLDHIDISNSTSNGLRSTGLSTGRVVINDSNISDSQGYNIVNSAAAAFDLSMTNVRCLNSGLGGNSAFRNIAPATSGAVRLWSCQIGRDNGSAASASWVDAGGSGSFINTDPTWIGTPPTSRESGAQLQDKRIAQPTGVKLVNTATYTVLPSDRDIRVNFAGVCTLTLPATIQSGEQRLTITTETANTVVSASANVSNKTGAAAATAILAAVAGSSAEIVGDAASGVWRIRMTS